MSQPDRANRQINPTRSVARVVCTALGQIPSGPRAFGVLTERGRGVAVLLDIREFEAMRERLSLLEDIARAEAQLAAGEGIPHEEAKARILRRIHECR